MRSNSKLHEAREGKVGGESSFVRAARENGCNEDEAAFDAKLRKIAKAKPKHEATVVHASDCALHNGPAYEAGPCDCGAVKAAR